MSMFDDFNNMFDLAGLAKDIEEVASSTREFVEVPHGDYEVRVASMELGETSEKAKNPGMPMAKVRMQVLAGEYKGQSIFMNQMLTSGFGIHKMNEFLDSLESGIPVVFENFSQYASLMDAVFDAVDGVGEYQLNFEENKKGFNTYTIVKRF